MNTNKERIKETIYIGLIGRNNGYARTAYKMPEDYTYKANNIFDNMKFEVEEKKEIEKLICSLPLGEILYSKKNSIDKVILIGDYPIKYKVTDEKAKILQQELESIGITIEGAEGVIEIKPEVILKKYFGYDKEKYKILSYDGEKRDYYTLYTQLVESIDSQEKDIELVLDISTGPRDIQNNIYNLIPAFENINNFKVENIYYGFYDVTKKGINGQKPTHDILDYKKNLNENRKIEKLKTFLNNYTVDKEFKDLIKAEDNNDLKEYLTKIQKFYNSFHLNNLEKVEENIQELINFELKKSDSLIYEVLQKIQETFKTKYNNDKEFLQNLQEDLLEKEYYQQVITMLEGQFRKELLKSKSIEYKDSKELYNKSRDELNKNTLWKSKWIEFTTFRNPLNHGTIIEESENTKKEFKEASDKIISLIQKAKKKEL